METKNFILIICTLEKFGSNHIIVKNYIITGLHKIYYSI